MEILWNIYANHFDQFQFDEQIRVSDLTGHSDFFCFKSRFVSSFYMS